MDNNKVQSAFIDEYYGELIRYVSLFSHSEELTLEIVGETFLRFMDDPALLNRYEKIWPILKKIAKNIFINEKRKLKRHRITCTEYCNFYPLHATNLEFIILHAEQSALILDAIKSLKEQHQQIIFLFYYGDHTLKEIAELLDWKYTTTLSRHRSAIRALKLNLSGDFDGFSDIADLDTLNTYTKRPSITYFFLFILYLRSLKNPL